MLDDKLAVAGLSGLAAPIRTALAKLQKQRAATAVELNSKFNEEGTAAFCLQV